MKNAPKFAIALRRRVRQHQRFRQRRPKAQPLEKLHPIRKRKKA